MPKNVQVESIKTEVLQLIQALPDDCTLEDIQYRLYLRQVLEEGIADVEQGNVIPDAEAKRRMRAWLKSRGRRKR